jgi:hypothetical protein
MTPDAVAARLVADPELARVDRIAIAMAMSADQFRVDDIARLTSIRRQTILGLRALNGLPPRPPNKASAAVNRQLDPVVQAIAAPSARARGLQLICRELGIHEISGWGIQRAVDYLRKADATPAEPRVLRCPGCEQRTTAHPCQHCGTEWLP